MKGLIQCPCCNQGDIDPRLKFIINSIERELGEELYSESCYRCPKHNAKKGGKENSAHIKGLAVDIRCENSNFRWKLVNKLCSLGIKRFGISFKGKYIHIDIDNTLPQMVIWGYE